MDLLHLSHWEIILRLAVSVVAGGLIGYERESKGRAAGFRTHILVAVGACVLALIQEHTTNRAILMAEIGGVAKDVLSADNTRLIAQVVSGIGFLGAGTIIVNKGAVHGLTTAASIWTAASLGIALGMGFYDIAVAGLVITLLTLLAIKRLFRFPHMKFLHVETEDETQIYALDELFEKHGIPVKKAVDTLVLYDDVLRHRREYKLDLRRVTDPVRLMKDIQNLGTYRLLQLTGVNDEIE